LRTINQVIPSKENTSITAKAIQGQNSFQSDINSETAIIYFCIHF
jgi:hypothetical protein